MRGISLIRSDYEGLPLEKKCKGCNEVKDATGFSINAWINSDGSVERRLISQCKQCRRKTASQQYLDRIKNNPEKIVELTHDGLPESKVCSRCKIEKKSNEFYVIRRKYNDLGKALCNHCSKCVKQDQDDYRRNRSDDRRKLANEKRKEWSKKNPHIVRNAQLKVNYGITLDEYNQILESQNGKCAICKCDKGKRRFCVDHDHKTGKVRKIICTNCNAMIGHSKESIETLEEAIKYLKEFK